jgi:hypothetical protein
MRRTFPSGSEAPRLYSEVRRESLGRKRRILVEIERLETDGRQDEAEELRCAFAEMEN